MPENLISSSVRENLFKYWDRRLPVKPDRIAVAMGIRLIPTPGRLYSGYLRLESSGPAIEYNSTESLTRQRFTIAHEIGHYVLKHQNVPRDSENSFESRVSSHIEREANQFAAELLMPEEAVVAMINQGCKTVDSLTRVFLVSPVAMAYRLVNLSY